MRIVNLPNGKFRVEDARVRAPALTRFTDGDTFWLHAEGLFRAMHWIEVRLLGWDTPEKQGPLTTAYERRMAKSAAELTRNWFLGMADADMRINTEPDPDKYGRWLGDPYVVDGERLGALLAAQGLAVPSDGSKTQKWRNTYTLS